MNKSWVLNLMIDSQSFFRDRKTINILQSKSEPTASFFYTIDLRKGCQKRQGRSLQEGLWWIDTSVQEINNFSYGGRLGWVFHSLVKIEPALFSTYHIEILKRYREKVAVKWKINTQHSSKILKYCLNCSLPHTKGK